MSFLSTTFLQTINVTSPLGLSQLAISSDGRRLFGTGSDNNEQVPNRRIYAINIDSKDRPKDEDSNPRKWHQQIGVISTISETEGIAATNEPTKMVFTNGLHRISPDQNNDGPGFGVLEITSDDPLNFTASVSYAPLSLGFATDYFDVNEGVSVTVTRDGRYGFVAGRNSASLGPEADVRSGGNIGIIKDPLGPNPQLLGATRPIPEALTNDLVLSNDNKYLYGSYPSLSGSGSVYAFDVEEIIKTLDNPGQFKIDPLDRGVKSPFFNATTARSVTAADFTRVPIDDINPAVSIAADYGILQENRPANQFTYGVPLGTTRAPVGTGGNLRDLSAAPTDWLDLKGPGATTIDLTPTFQWQFAPGWEDVKEVNLFVSTFEQGKRLLPWDRWEDLANIQNPNFNNLSPQQQQNLLAKWNSQFGTYDYNPNRILTATWKPGQGWVGLGGLPLDPSNTNTQFTLPDNRTLTAGQTYHWAVEALSKDGKRNLDVGQFKTSPPPALNGNSTFSSVTVLTHGFKPPVITAPGIPSEFYKMADSIATTGGEGLLMRYDSPTGDWVPVNKYGQVKSDFFSNSTYFPNGFDLAAPSYRTALSSYIAPYLQANKPLVLLPDWSQNNESAIPDSGFTEGAADSFFASLVQLDQSLGGGAKFDSQGNFVRSQGAIFNSPLHFVGFSRGAVVNSEMIQRVGTYFPLAGGKENSLFRDLQMTTLDPHDFDQPSFSVQLPFLGEAGFADFREPKVQVWKNVTFADNYYQTVPRLDQGIPQIPTLTPAGRDIPNLSGPDALRTEIRTGLKFPRNSAGELLGRPDETVFLGTRRNADGYENSLPGFTKDDLAGGPHGRVLTWYAGTADLGLTEYRQDASSTQPVDPIARRRGDGYYEQLFDKDFSFSGTSQDPRVNPWYTPKYRGQPNFPLGAANAPNEGIGTGWFYSVLGGGLTKDPNTGAIANLRPTNNVERVPLSFDNTAESRMRGDFAIPTLFGGNFDAVFNPRSLFRNAISDAIPGWSFHGGTSNIASPTSRLVDWRDIPSLDNYRPEVGYDPAQPNYALELKGGESITHNQFLVPDWGTLRFNLHVPGLDQAPPILPGQIPHLRVFMTDSESGTEYDLTSRVLFKGEFLNSPRQVERDAGVEIVFRDAPTVPNYRSNRIAYGVEGFETFHLDVPDELRGKSATLRFQLDKQSQEVYLDDVFFQSSHLQFGNPTEARIEFSPNFTEVQNDIRNEIHRDNYLMEKPQYVVSYNDITKNPNWVSWQLNRTWLGSLERENFARDLTLPDNWYQVKGDDYSTAINYSEITIPGLVNTNRNSANFGQPYELRPGHLVPAADRDRNRKDASAVALMTNIIPQHEFNNSPIWKGLEEFSRQLVTDRGRELYIVAGGYGTKPGKETIRASGSDNANQINVPEFVWKIIIVLDRPGQGIADITKDTQVIAVVSENDIPRFSDGTPVPGSGNNDYPRWYEGGMEIISIRELENRLNADPLNQYLGSYYDFLSNIPQEIQEAIENRRFTWPIINSDPINYPLGNPLDAFPLV